MNILRLLPLAALLVAAAPADQRIRTLDWNADRVFSLAGRPGVETVLIMAPEERIETVAVGDARAWQITPSRRAHLLFVKPLPGAARTNMIVVTNQRQYLFDLVSGNGPPIYAVRFTYPAPPAPAVATPPLPPAPRPVNMGWTSKGDALLLPRRIWDDGRDTYLEWPDDRDLPGVFLRDGAGNEGAANVSVRDGAIVVEGVAREYVLRLGKAMATVTGPHGGAR